MVFVSDKSLIIWLFMFAISIGISVAQFVYADAYGIILVGADGKPLKDIVSKIENVATFNKILTDANSINPNDLVGTLFGTGSAIVDLSITLVELASGVYIFDILWHLGVPTIFVAGMVLMYIALLARSILAWIRGVF